MKRILFSLMSWLLAASLHAQSPEFESNSVSGTGVRAIHPNGTDGWLLTSTYCGIYNMNSATHAEEWIIEASLQGIAQDGSGLWSIPVEGGPQDLWRLPDSSWAGVFQQEQDGTNPEWFLPVDFIRFRPDGTLLSRVQFQVNPSYITSPVATCSDGQGNLFISLGGKWVNTELMLIDTLGNPIASALFTPVYGALHDLAPVSWGNLVYCAADSGLVRLSMSSGYSQFHPRSRPVTWLHKSGPNLLYFADSAGVYACDSNFVLTDSVILSSSGVKTEESAGSFWFYNTTTAWELDPALNILQTVSLTPVQAAAPWSSTTGSVNQGRYMAGGYQFNTAWKSQDLAGNYVQFDDNIELTRVTITQAQYTFYPIPNIYVTDVSFEASIRNTGSSVINQFAFAYNMPYSYNTSYMPCNRRNETSVASLNLLPGDSVVITQNLQFSSHSFAGAYAYIHCIASAPNGHLEADTTHQILSALAPLIVSRPEPTATTLTLSPNPARDAVHMSSSAPLRSFSLCDLHGRFLRSGDLSGLTGELRVEDLPAGLYLLTVETMEGLSLPKRLEVVR